MIRLVDTSVWLEFLRKSGARGCQEEVVRLMKAREAAYCGPVELELMAGARTPREAEYVRLTLDACVRLDVEEVVWAVAGHAQFLLARKGQPVGLGDLLIAAVARAHGASVVTRDSDFERIRDGLWAELNVEKI